MGAIGRILAIIVMGAVLLAISGIPLAFSIAAAATPDKPPSMLALTAPYVAVAAVTLFVAIAAPTARIAWGRLCIIAGVAGFALPLEGLLASALMSAQIVGRADSAAGRAGEAIGAGLGMAAISGVAAFVGIFVGLAFVAAGALTLHGAARPLRIGA